MRCSGDILVKAACEFASADDLGKTIVRPLLALFPPLQRQGRQTIIGNMSRIRLTRHHQINRIPVQVGREATRLGGTVGNEIVELGGDCELRFFSQLSNVQGIHSSHLLFTLITLGLGRLQHHSNNSEVTEGEFLDDRHPFDLERPASVAHLAEVAGTNTQCFSEGLSFIGPLNEPFM